MKMNLKTLSKINWVLIAIALLTFFYSLRDPRHAYVAGGVALALWAIAYGLELYIKKQRKKEEQ
ncbi:hypothetical protein [Aureibacter tunicatorum]|uniref:Heme O synthase-like polyprenyltransferase n=1 Tax=Aureibacter tunicatorum TaxID=866807 RepID=A0AAE3XIL9_9BACT|nr:hypothetical protein [Aureibacter tunicatorum]MDR6237497.1 heme O synthase-like polyprenyltransferase [Aureibacter tunicatorum]BDD02531.1 hypothetical protein AUTU_00140 [Aureibacter tunicatorum]